VSPVATTRAIAHSEAATTLDPAEPEPVIPVLPLANNEHE